MDAGDRLWARSYSGAGSLAVRPTQSSTMSSQDREGKMRREPKDLSGMARRDRGHQGVLVLGFALGWSHPWASEALWDEEQLGQRCPA